MTRKWTAEQKAAIAELLKNPIGDELLEAAIQKIEARSQQTAAEN